VVEVLGEAPLALGLVVGSLIGGLGGEVFSVGSGEDFFYRLGAGFFFVARPGVEIVRARELAGGEAHDRQEEPGEVVVDGFGGDGAGEVGEDLLDVGAVVEARDVDAGGRAAGVGVAAEVASVREAVGLAAEGEASAGVSVGLDVAALHFWGGFGGHGFLPVVRVSRPFRTDFRGPLDDEFWRISEFFLAAVKMRLKKQRRSFWLRLFGC
jgi:hypothetical protein